MLTMADGRNAEETASGKRSGPLVILSGNVGDTTAIIRFKTLYKAAKHSQFLLMLMLTYIPYQMGLCSP